MKPVKPLRKAKKERTLKTITVDDRVAKYGKYGLYNNNGVLTCRPCGQRLDYTRDDVITTHDTQIGYLLAMVNGDVNHRIPQWAFV